MFGLRSDEFREWPRKVRKYVLPKHVPLYVPQEIWDFIIIYDLVLDYSLDHK